MLVLVVKDLKFKTGLPLRSVCERLQVPWSSFGRWQKRARVGNALVRVPGPAKPVAPDMDVIRGEVAQLTHGQGRTAGTTALYASHQESISRRELAALVAETRAECNRERRAHLQHLCWQRTGVVWSMDATECERSSDGGEKVVVQQIEELCSRYKLPPIVSHSLVGEEIAGHLEALLCHNPAPLLLKRDNGGNMNHPAVDEVLQKHYILPLNSPVHYAPYNGAMERAQSDLKEPLDAQLRYLHLRHAADAEPYARAVANELNHVPRECLNGKTSCQVFNDPAMRITFTRTERSEAYEWIIQRKNDITHSAGSTVTALAAWRIAVKQWLLDNGLLTITVNKKVSPNYP